MAIYGPMRALVDSGQLLIHAFIDYMESTDVGWNTEALVLRRLCRKF
jgi:hypothetical protein